MQKTLENWSSVTLFFFIILGGLHLSSTFLIAEGIQNKNVTLIFHSFELPFLLVALLYGSSRLSLLIEETTEKGRLCFLLCSVLTAILVGLAFYLNFAFPDAKTF